MPPLPPPSSPSSGRACSSRDATATAVLAVFIALLTSPFLPAGVPVILAAAAALVVGLRHPGRHERPLEGADGGLPGSDPTP